MVLICKINLGIFWGFDHVLPIMFIETISTIDEMTISKESNKHQL